MVLPNLEIIFQNKGFQYHVEGLLSIPSPQFFLKKKYINFIKSKRPNQPEQYEEYLVAYLPPKQVNWAMRLFFLQENVLLCSLDGEHGKN